MKNIVLILAIINIFSALSNAKNSISELPRLHASALQQFLKQHTELEFLPETKFDTDELKSMRENLGATLTPYYLSYDLNHDGIKDFAVILKKKGLPLRDEGPAFRTKIGDGG